MAKDHQEMSEWISESEITTRLGHKILIAGLSEAGKTAVKRIFFLKQHTQEVDRLSATINYERMSVSIKGTPVTIVDLGGQKIFIKRFLNNFSPFIFSSVKIFIFLIDVANKTTRSNAIQYFASCYKNLQKFSPHVNLFVFLHKNDLLKRSPNYESIHTQLKEQFQLECPTRELSFFRTTIYKPNSVIDAFGRIFELTVPNLANSTFVEGRTIGKIEEYSKEDMTLRKPVVEEVKPISTTEKLLKTSGDPEVLNKLKILMQQAIHPELTTKTPTKAYSVENQVIGEEEAIEEVYTKHLADLSTEKEELTTIEPMISKTISLPIFEPATPDERINHLVNFYNIQLYQASMIVNLGYDYVFELSAASGIRIPIVLKVLLNYIPFLKSKGLKVDALYHDRILDIFATFLEGGVTETELIKFLIYAIERPMMPVNTIVNHYFIRPKREALASKSKMITPFETKKLSSIELPIMIRTGIKSGAINLPALRNLSFKADIIEFNAYLTFYSDNAVLNSSMIPNTITIDEIKYLLTFEMSLHALGFFKEGLKSLTIAARIIYGVLQKLHDENIVTTSELSVKENFLELPIVMDVKVDENRFIIPDNRDLSFKIKKAEQGIIIQFFKNEEVISAITVQINITIQELIEKIRDLNLRALPNHIIDFSARIIHSIINKEL